MKISFNEMRSLIENYNRNLEDYEKIQEKLKENKYHTKVIANYGLDNGGSGGSFNNSKVENKVIERITLQNKAADYAEKIYIVIKAENILTKQEKQIIEFLKLGDTYKLSTIAKLMNKKKNFVFKARNRAINKMCEYIGGMK